MKKNGVWLALAMLLSGCVVGSVNPYYTDDVVVKMPEIQGEWFSVNENSEEKPTPFTFNDGSLTILDDNDVPHPVKATLFKVEGTLFLDVFPEDGELKKELVGEGQPIHLLYKVALEDDDKLVGKTCFVR